MQSNGVQVSYGAQLRASMQTLRANDAQFEQFTRGLGAVLQQWTALQLVAQHCDSRAPAVLHEDLCAWHKRDGEVYVDDMEVYFEEFFDNIRSARIEDDSMHEVGTVVHDMYCRCCLNDFSMVEHYLQTLATYAQTNPVAMSVNGGTAENLEDDAEEDAEVSGDADCEEGVDNEDEESEPMQVLTPQAPQQPSQAPRHQQQQQPQRKKRKNASVRSKDGWNIVQ